MGVYIVPLHSPTVEPLPFASGYRLITAWFSTVIFPRGTFTPLVHAHAGHTQIAAVSGLRPPDVTDVPPLCSALHFFVRLRRL